MNISVQSKTFAVTDALRNFCLKQAKKMARFNKTISSINIYVENNKKKKNDPGSASVQYSVNVPGRVLVVKRKAVNIYDAVVDATGSVIRQVREFKHKRLPRNR